jgi:hypothetical protein
MGPIVYALCQKPVLGLVLYIGYACSFPPLFSDAPLPLQQENASVSREFEAPVSLTYSLLLKFQFRSADSLRSNDVWGVHHATNCYRDDAGVPQAERAGLGRPVPIHVLIRERRNGAVVLDKVFDTVCTTSWSANAKTMTIGRVYLAEGNYVADIRNLARQDGLDGVKTTVLLVRGGGK